MKTLHVPALGACSQNRGNCGTWNHSRCCTWNHSEYVTFFWDTLYRKVRKVAIQWFDKISNQQNGLKFKIRRKMTKNKGEHCTVDTIKYYITVQKIFCKILFSIVTLPQDRRVPSEYSIENIKRNDKNVWLPIRFNNLFNFNFVF